MINAIIIDDEERSVENLESMLKTHCPEVNIIAKRHCVPSGFEAIRTLKPQLVFLDVDMPPYTAFDLLRMFDYIHFDVVFVTAFDHFAIDAIKFSALYYILKPIRAEELIEAVQRAKSKNEADEPMNMNFFKEIADGSEITSIVIQTHRGAKSMKFFDIIYIKAEGNYSTFILKNGEKITSSQTLKNYENMLGGKGFFRCHKAFLINLKNLSNSHYLKDENVLMSNGDKVTLSVRRKEDFLNKIKQIR
jgi:two-component system LytT family response regulator